MAKPTPNRCGLCLGRRIQHVFDKNAVAGGWVIHKDMGDSAYGFFLYFDGDTPVFCLNTLEK